MSKSEKGERISTGRILSVVLSIVASICAGLIPTWTHSDTNGQFSTGDQVILGISVFVAFQLVDISFTLGAVLAERKRRALTETITHECDLKLFNMQGYFHKIIEDSYGPNDYYVKRFLRDLTRIETELKDAAERKEIRARNEHFLSVSDVLGAFGSDPQRVYRYTWPIGPEGLLFNVPAWRRFFQLTASMVKDGQIRKVRIIVIVDAIHDAERKEVRTLLDFYRATPGFECKVIIADDWRVIAADNSVSPHNMDFGIYGSRLLYVTEEEHAPEIVGVFSKNSDQIDRYTRLFEAIWSSQAIARDNPSNAKRPPSLDLLFGLDSSNVTGGNVLPVELPTSTANDSGQQVAGNQ